jgi:protoporphyrinogen oxidase
MATDQWCRNTEQVDTVILGAGISGLVATKIANKSKGHRALVIDEYDRIGGNHISCDFGPFTFDIGTLIFQDDSPLMKYFPELLPLYHPIDWSISRVAPDNVIREYPLSMKEEVYGVGPLEMLRLFGSIAWGRCRSRHFANADEYARYWIGSRLFERSGLAHYIKRFYGVPATAIDPIFAAKRMGWLADGASVWKRITKLLGRKETWKTNQSFVRPRLGFGDLYAAARRTLEQEGTNFALGESLRSVTRHGTLFHVVTDRFDITCQRLISTIPVDRAYKLCGLGAPDPLPFSRLISLFFSFAGDRGFRSSILYNFSERGDWKRLTMFSDFFGPAAGREYFGVEVTSTEKGPALAAKAAASFQADVEDKGLFTGLLTFVGSHELEHAYPIYTHGASERANHMIGALRAFGVESMGRQGGFDYLPTARQVTITIEAAMNVNHGPSLPNSDPPHHLRKPCP